MIEYVGFQIESKKTKNEKMTDSKIEFSSKEKITITRSPYDDFDRIITYRNRKGEEYTRI